LHIQDAQPADGLRIDCSGSMEALVTEKDKFEDGHYPDLSRMEIVRPS